MLKVKIVLALVVAVAACHGAPSPAPPSNQAASPAAAAAARDPLAFLPLDAEVVVHIDAKALRASALWHEYQPRIVAALGPQFADAKQRCGFDPMEAFDSITVGGHGEDKLVAVVRGLDRERALACLRTASLPGRQVTVEPDLITMKLEAGRTELASFVDGTTLVVDASSQTSREQLHQLVAGGAPLRSSPAFLEMFDKLDHDATLWLLINGNAKVLEGFKSMGIQPRGVFGTVRLAAGLASRINVRLPSADQATQLASMLNAQLNQARAMVGHAEVTTAADVATFQLDMSADQLRSIIGMMSGMFGAMDKP